MIASIRQAYWRFIRKQARKLAADRSHNAHWKAVRGHHQRDPLWNGGDRG